MNLQRAAYKFKVGPYKIIPVEKKRCESTKRSLQLQDAALQYTSVLWHVPEGGRRGGIYFKARRRAPAPAPSGACSGDCPLGATATVEAVSCTFFVRLV